jgi:hypothetical protein
MTYFNLIKINRCGINIRKLYVHNNELISHVRLAAKISFARDE